MVNGASFQLKQFQAPLATGCGAGSNHMIPAFRNQDDQGFSITQQIEKRIGAEKSLSILTGLFYNPNGIYAQSLDLWLMMSNVRPDFFSPWFMALNQFRKKAIKGGLYV